MRIKLITYIQARIILAIARRKAEMLHAKTGKQYFVTVGSNHRPLIVDYKVFKRLRQKGFISREALRKDLKEECFYYTDSPFRFDIISESERKLKRKLWVMYCYKYWK